MEGYNNYIRNKQNEHAANINAAKQSSIVNDAIKAGGASYGMPEAAKQAMKAQDSKADASRVEISKPKVDSDKDKPKESVKTTTEVKKELEEKANDKSSNDKSSNDKSSKEEKKSETKKEEVVVKEDKKGDISTETIDTEKVVEGETDKVVDDSSKQVELKQEVNKTVKPQIGRLKEALSNGEITKEEYNHYVFDRVMSAIGKTLGFFVSRNPEWLFYKDQWAQRNDNLLKERQRLDRARTTANQTLDETKGAQARDEQKVFTGEEAFAHNNEDLYNKLNESSQSNEAAKQVQAELSSLYARKEQIDEQISMIRRGDYDLSNLNQMISDSVSAWKGLNTTVNYSGNTLTTNESESQGEEKRSNNNISGSASVSGNIGVTKGNVQVGASHGSSKGTTSNKQQGSGSNKASQYTANYDKYASEIANMLKKGYIEDSKQIKSMSRDLLKTLENEKRFIDSQIRAAEKRATKISGETISKVSDEELDNNRIDRIGGM